MYAPMPPADATPPYSPIHRAAPIARASSASAINVHLHQPTLLQERPRARGAPAEAPEHLERMLAASQREDRVAEAAPGLAQAIVARLEERAVRVGGQHLGSLVAEIPRGVASGEDVREAAQEPGLGQRRHDRVLGPHAPPR